VLIAALSTTHKIGLGVIGCAFIAFALISSMVIPRSRPDFPAKRLAAFIGVCFLFFVAMMLAVVIFGRESEEATAGEGESTTVTQTAPAPTTTSAEPEAPSAALVAQGKELYTKDGCSGCHSLDGTAGAGPTWKGLYDSQVSLDDGSTVTADDAYLEKSITDPDAEIVQGFQKGIMSASVPKGAIPPEDAKALVAYIESVK